MNARMFSKVRVGLAVTAMAACGALVFTGSTGCGGDSNTAGNGGGNTPGAGGSGSGSGGSAGGGNGGGSCSAGADSVCFATGKASGLMTGYGWIALGSADTVTSPVCAPSPTDLTTTRPITQANACPESGTTVWSSATDLCLKGSIPIVAGADYNSNWGIQIGVNVGEDATTTLGKAYSKVTFNFTGAPAGAEMRAEIHVKGDPNLDASHSNYCAIVTSGKPTSLSALNTECWSGGLGKDMPAGSSNNIDKIGIQISSSDKSAFTVDNFCLTGVSFSN